MARKFDHGYSFRSADFNGTSRRPAPGAPSVTTEGQRPCARGGHCARASVVTGPDGTSHREPALGYQAFCPGDEAAITRALDGMPLQYACLLAEIGNPAREGQMIRMPFGPRVPLRLDIDTLARFMREVLACWEERVRAAARLSELDTHSSRLRRGLVAVHASAVLLAAHQSVLLALQPEPVSRDMDLMEVRRIEEGKLWSYLLDGTVHVTRDAGMAGIVACLDGADAGAEILALEYLARSVLGETRPQPEKMIGVACRADDCGWRTLVRAELPSREDEPVWWSRCTRCGDRMTETEYREWTALCAAYERHRTAVPVLENLPVVA